MLDASIGTIDASKLLQMSAIAQSYPTANRTDRCPHPTKSRSILN